MAISYNKLFELMNQKGIKKIDLRNKYKINPKTVDSLVNNRSVTVDTLMILCEILDCQPGDIVEYVREEEPKAE
ncbi:MAG: helix-turn-helix transcriptional regulator [Oscillospiraceae bacterium]|nr:helix-turn-helix transcriptional regulator [Oscillospiraceae bacterium]